MRRQICAAVAGHFSLGPGLVSVEGVKFDQRGLCVDLSIPGTANVAAQDCSTQVKSVSLVAWLMNDHHTTQDALSAFSLGILQ